jgi:Signal peptide peptidase
MPMLLLVPRFLHFYQTGYSMLGFGDVVLPGARLRGIAEINGMQLGLFGMQNRTLGPYLMPPFFLSHFIYNRTLGPYCKAHPSAGFSGRAALPMDAVGRVWHAE